jgi:hypothetical protein
VRFLVTHVTYGIAEKPCTLPDMAASAMRIYLARVAREAREEAGRKPFNIGSAPRGEKGADPSTVWRFENEAAWPRNPDLMIDLYARETDLEPIELWTRALELWRQDVSQAGEQEAAARDVTGAADLLSEASESPPSSVPDQRENRPAAKRRKTA